MSRKLRLAYYIRIVLYCIVDILRPLGNLTKKSALPVLYFFVCLCFYVSGP